MDLTTPANFELVQESFGLLPTPAKFHLPCPNTRGGTNLCIRRANVSATQVAGCFSGEGRQS
jgi:hypothetical protein